MRGSDLNLPHPGGPKIIIPIRIIAPYTNSVHSLWNLLPAQCWKLRKRLQRCILTLRASIIIAVNTVEPAIQAFGSSF